LTGINTTKCVFSRRQNEGRATSTGTYRTHTEQVTLADSWDGAKITITDKRRKACKTLEWAEGEGRQFDD